jgi:cell division septation protein DedD
MMKRWRVALLLSVLFVVGVRPALGQSGLERVDELTRLGRADEARAALTEWWEGDREGASRRELQRGLWLRGRLTVDPVQAELDFQRLVVLYPSGQFTPDALLRLAQGAFATGDEEGARRYVATLARDYPRSDASERAEMWLTSAGPVPPAGDTPTSNATAPAEVDATVAVAPAGADDQRVPDSTAAEAPAQSAESSIEPPVDSADAPPVADPAGADAAAASTAGDAGAGAVAGPPMNYFVQLGAFADEDRAMSLFDELSGAGVDVRVVRVEGSRFTHVRVGRFAQRESAVEVLDELTRQGVSAALVRDDRPERLLRGGQP